MTPCLQKSPPNPNKVWLGSVVESCARVGYPLRSWICLWRWCRCRGSSRWCGRGCWTDFHPSYPPHPSPQTATSSISPPTSKTTTSSSNNQPTIYHDPTISTTAPLVYYCRILGIQLTRGIRIIIVVGGGGPTGTWGRCFGFGGVGGSDLTFWFSNL